MVPKWKNLCRKTVARVKPGLHKELIQPGLENIYDCERSQPVQLWAGNPSQASWKRARFPAKAEFWTRTEVISSNYKINFAEMTAEGVWVSSPSNWAEIQTGIEIYLIISPYMTERSLSLKTKFWRIEPIAEEKMKENCSMLVWISAKSLL